MEEKITKLQAFNAMRKFLEVFYEQTNSDDVGTLLGEMQFHEDGSTFDPATWEEWLGSIDFVLKEEQNK